MATATLRAPSKHKSRYRRGAKPAGNLFDGKIVVHFAGFGGTCRGIELAEGRAVDDAINHDAIAIKCHEVNYPNTKHHQEDVFHVDPTKVAAGKRIDTLWASPDCRGFSRAKGATPVGKKIRALAWVVVKWAMKERPDRLFLENVREFLDWGPLLPYRNAEGECLWRLVSPTRKGKKGKPIVGPEPKSDAARRFKLAQRAIGHIVEPLWMPDPDRKGETYKKWKRQLELLGYVIETKTLNAADFGAPTHRRRFILIARRDGEPIQWPEPTHGPGRAKPWRTAAECMDFSIPCPSIFLSKPEAKRLGYNVQRPLKDKTLYRVANGIKRYVIESKKPFIIRTGHWSNITGAGAGFRGQGLDQPLGAVCGTNDKALAMPWLVMYYGQGSGLTGHPVNQPAPTIVSRDRIGLATSIAVKVNHGGPEFRGQPLDQPFPTLTGSHGTAEVAASLIQYNQEKGNETRALPVDAPINTIPTENRFALVSAFLARIGQYGSNGKMSWDAREPLTTITSKQEHLAATAHLTKLRGSGGAKAIDKPLDTVVAGATTFAQTTAHLAQFYGGMTGKPLTDPLPAITAIDHNGVVQTELAPFIAGVGGRTGQGNLPTSAADAPLGTITGKNDRALAAASLVRCAHSGDGRWGHGEHSATEPLPTIPGSKDFAAVAASLVHMHNGKGKQWADIESPLGTIRAAGQHHANIEASLVAHLGPGVWEAFCRVYEFLKEHLGDDAPLPIVEVDGAIYLIVDIGLRMLKPRELLNAQFSPELAKDYILIGTLSQQVRLIGNSVPPLLAAAIVAANPLAKNRSHTRRERRAA
jgi:DNA (cytosine-5)-methyltransferase 1